ncbi:MAG TPA: response regulator [Burkholderiales bacterium]|jgi:FixJ family two-component response regulator|nr:response regulator [Burkholderiales bacterium]
MSPAVENDLVYIVDDDEAMRDSLGWLLESTGYRTAAFSTAERFLEGYSPGFASCLVLDVRMPGLSGLELQQELNRRGETLPIIFITGHGDVPMAVNAVKNGAFHFLEKPFKDAQLLALIEQAAGSGIAAQERVQGPCVAARLASLTQREREVIDLVVQGLKNRQIADHLHISVKTVEAHRARVMVKMDVGSVAELVQAALSAQRPR